MRRRAWALPAALLLACGGAVAVTAVAQQPPEPLGCRIELYRGAGTFEPICPAGVQPPGDLASWPVVVYP